MVYYIYHPPSSQCFYHWVDTSAGGLLVPDGITLLVANASALTWFIIYIILPVVNVSITGSIPLLVDY